LGGGVNVDLEKNRYGDNSAQEVKDLIDRFLEHPLVEFDLRLTGMFTLLANVLGELFIPVFVAPENGDVALGFLEYHQVREVVFNPHNRMEAIGVVQVPPGGGQQPIWWNVIRAEQGQDTPMFPKHPGFSPKEPAVPEGYTYGGEIMYFRTNTLGSGRGRSSLEPCLDWLHAYDQFLFGDLRNANLQAAFVWDVEIQDATESELERRAEEIRLNPPRPGEVNFHNQREKWQALSPNLNASSHAQLGSQVKRVIGLALGLPSHLIGAEEGVNRTTSMSSDMPMVRRMERLQRLLRHVVKTIVDYQLDQKVHANLLSHPRPYPYRIVLPQLTSGEIAAQAEALLNITNAVTAAMQNRVVGVEEARRVWYAYGLTEPDVPRELGEQVEEDIKNGFLPDPNADTEQLPSTQVGTNPGRVKRASIPGRDTAS
jgi:hypothetical protein